VIKAGLLGLKVDDDMAVLRLVTKEQLGSGDRFIIWSRASLQRISSIFGVSLEKVSG